MLADRWSRDSLTATARATNPEPSGWSLTEHLLAMVVDELRVSNWQRSKAGQKGHNRPKPISPLARTRGTRIGKTTRPPEQIAALLAKYGPGPRPVGSAPPEPPPPTPRTPLERKIAQLESELGIGKVDEPK